MLLFCLKVRPGSLPYLTCVSGEKGKTSRSILNSIHSGTLHIFTPAVLEVDLDG